MEDERPGAEISMEQENKSDFNTALMLLDDHPEHLESLRILFALKHQIRKDDEEIRKNEILKRVRNHLKRTLRKTTDDIERFTIVSSLVRVGTIEDISLLLEVLKKSTGRTEKMLLMTAIADIAARCCNIEIESLTDKMFLGVGKKEDHLPQSELEHALG